MRETKIQSVSIKNNVFQVKGIKYLTESAYILQFEKNQMKFQAGQYITLGIPGKKEMREYSIYSGENDPYLEVLIKEVEDGDVSKALKKMNVGDFVKIEGPLGFFVLDKNKVEKSDFLFIATGTGISPFHSYVKSNPKLNYTILHGIKRVEENYGYTDYIDESYISCTSRDDKGKFHGRVTDYLKKNNINKSSLCYLCGNSDMIYEAFDILRAKGIPSENIFMEVYF